MQKSLNEPAHEILVLFCDVEQQTFWGGKSNAPTCQSLCWTYSMFKLFNELSVFIHFYQTFSKIAIILTLSL